MIRAPLGDAKYWDTCCNFLIADIGDRLETIKSPSGDPTYRPQYLFNLARENWHLLFCCYSRGDTIRDLTHYFPPLLDAWEESERLGKTVWTTQQQHTRNAWAVNLDHYIVCFWLVGLALALNIPDDQWQRLLVLIGNEGEDELLDRVIAKRQPNRKIGNKLCHPKPYQRLLDAINAPPDKQPQMLFTFVDKWYKELNRSPKNGLSEQTAMYERPYWYTLGNRQLEDSGYFGRWCVEAVAAVKAFSLDDTLCLGHEHYPGDLLRPDGPSTHPLRPEEETLSTPPEPPATDRPGIWSRLFGRK